MRSKGTSPLHRGFEAEDSFRKLLGDAIILSTSMEDRFDHIDFKIPIDVKKIKSVDEFGESNYHWLEIMNVNGNTGWLYGKSLYFAFETKDYWVVVGKKDLHDLVKEKVTDTTIVFEKLPYRVYRRPNRLDKVVMVSVLDLCYLGFMVKKV